MKRLISSHVARDAVDMRVIREGMKDMKDTGIREYEGFEGYGEYG